MNKTILFVVNVDWFFISHRLILAEAALKNGYKVYLASRDTGRRNEIESVGVNFIDLNFERSGTNPIKELYTLNKFYKIYKKVNPDIVQHITLKPVIYGSLVSRWLGIPTVNAISGLGYNFSEEQKGFSSKIMTYLMKLGFKNKRLTCIFQNQDDRKVVENRKVFSKTTKIVMIKGAGVNLEEFAFTELSSSKKIIEIVLPARLLWDKGVKEFYKSSLLLKDKYFNKVLFKLVGLADKENKEGVTESQLKKWNIPNYFQWVPYQKNMVDVYKNSDIIVLPSYREGMPKSLLEACAIGRPIVTTKAIGCKECVDEGINGFKVPVRSVDELAFAIEKLILSFELRKKMGQNSRMKAEKEFNQEYVILKHLEIYSSLIGV